MFFGVGGGDLVWIRTPPGGLVHQSTPKKKEMKFMVGIMIIMIMI